MNKLATLSLALIVSLSGWSSSANASTTIESPVFEWSSIHGNASIYSEHPIMLSTSDGGYVTARTNITADFHTSIYIVKTDNNGTTLWEQKIDTTNEDINLYSIIEVSDGSILIGGNVIDTSLSQSLLYLIKLHSDGTTDWSRKYPEYSNNGHNLTGDAILETNSGDFFITGYTHNRSRDASAYLLKIDPVGDPLWYKTYTFGDSQYFTQLASTPDDGVIAGGIVTPKYSLNQNSIVYAKINAQGDLIWERLYTLNNTVRYPNSIQTSQDGGYVIAGSSHSQEIRGRNFFLQKIDSDGNVLWDKSLHSVPDYDSYDYYFNIEPIQDGYAVIGHNSQGNFPTHTDYHKIIFTDTNGEINKTYLFRYPDLYTAKGGKPTPDGGFIVVGEIKKNNNYYMQLTKIAGPGVEPTDPTLTKLEFQTPNLEISVGKTVKSVVSAVYSNNSVTDATYSAVYKSLDLNIATIDAQGQITGVSPGTTLITASYGGHLASVTVEVQADTSTSGQFFLDSRNYSLSVGTELDVAAYFTDGFGQTSLVTPNSTFSSDDPQIATIDEYGNIHGINPGKTYITATYKGLTYRSSVWVVRPYVPPTI
ncbi:Bacterial Ig-like domain (group 2) [compost metagenome]